MCQSPVSCSKLRNLNFIGSSWTTRNLHTPEYCICPYLVENQVIVSILLANKRIQPLQYGAGKIKVSKNLNV